MSRTRGTNDVSIVRRSLLHTGRKGCSHIISISLSLPAIARERHNAKNMPPVQNPGKDVDMKETDLQLLQPRIRSQFQKDSTKNISSLPPSIPKERPHLPPQTLEPIAPFKHENDYHTYSKANE